MKYPDDFINKIICGDSLKVIKNIPDNSIDLIIADPPYNVTNQLWDKNNIINEQFSKDLLKILKSSGNFYCWGGIGEKSQTIVDWFLIFKNTGWHFKDWITWKKQRGMGNRKGWLYTREEILWFVKDNKQFCWNSKNQYSDEKRIFTATYKDKEREKKYLSSVKSDYKRLTNIWTDIRETNISWNKKEINTPHYTPKPIKAMERIILLHTNENDLVFDPFIGSGTTAIACLNLNRNYIGIDISKEYCELARKRINEI